MIYINKAVNSLVYALEDFYENDKINVYMLNYTIISWLSIYIRKKYRI